VTIGALIITAAVLALVALAALPWRAWYRRARLWRIGRRLRRRHRAIEHNLAVAGRRGPAVSLTAVDAIFKDRYATPGTFLKRYVVEERQLREWERATCPRVEVLDHDDNTGTGCRNVGDRPWVHLDHDCCLVCNDLQAATASRPDVSAWCALKAERPPITTDREALSDEIAPEDVSVFPAFITKATSGSTPRSIASTKLDAKYTPEAMASLLPPRREGRGLAGTGGDPGDEDDGGRS
jgi:hypothetical protein